MEENKKLKISFVLTPSFNPNDGGVQRTTFKLGKFFTEKGHFVSYFSFERGGHVNSDYGVLYHSQESGGCDIEKNIQELDRMLIEFNPDFVINQMPYEKKIREALYKSKLKYSFVLLGCLRNSLFSFKNNVREITIKKMPNWLIPFVDNKIVLGGINQFHKIKHGVVLKKIIDVHDKYILLAPPNREELKFFIGDYKSDKVLDIPNSIPEIFQSDLQRENIILHVGRIVTSQKRSDLLIPFWEKVYLELPDWKFVIVGDGPYLKKLYEEVKAKNLPRVEIVGFQRPESFYEKSQIFMMPSAYEGFPNTVLEAQSYGCVPFAYNSYSAINWIVNDQTDAFLIQPFDSEKMASQVVKLARDKELLRKTSFNATVNANRFLIDQVGEIWIDLFKDSYVEK